MLGSVFNVKRFAVMMIMYMDVLAYNVSLCSFDA